MGGGWFNRELKIFVLFLGLISFSNLIFSNNTFASYTPTLSASVDNAAASVNGNQVINSTDKTTEIPLNLTVNTNNKTGYTATLNSETDETALVNIGSTSGAKINSISSTGPLGDFSNNTWGYKFGASSNYAPIPALSTPAQILQTAGKTNGNESNQLSIGMKLSDTLESGRYTNKLIFSILTNNYDPIAIMTEGPDFNTKLKALETATNKIEHFKKSPVAPAASMNTINIEDEESECEIKLWLDPTNNTAYYYTEPEKVYLNEDSSRMFSDLSNLISLDVSSFDTSQVTSMIGMFFDAHELTSLNVSSFDTSNVTDMSRMFGALNLTTLDLSNFDTSKVTNMSGMFYDMRSLISLNVSNFDTSKVTDMRTMFSGLLSLTSLNVSNFDTSQVTDMNSMFSGMSLTDLNLSNFDTSKVTNMSYMFSGMFNLPTLNVSNFDTSKVTNMSYMFSNMRNLTSLDLSNFNTSKVTDMDEMFSNMFNLTSLDLSNFNTSKVTSMYFMFYGMHSLTTLDLSNFDTSNVWDMCNMFILADEDKLNDKLETIYVNNDFNTVDSLRTCQMFKNRKKLRGGAGSFLTDPSTAGKSWLRIDDPAHGRPGYFTRKP